VTGSGAERSPEAPMPEPMPEAEPQAHRTGPHPALRFLFVKIPYVLTGIIFLVAVLINIVNVIGRYLFASPIFWAEEVLVFMIVWAVFLSAASITFNGANLSMDLFYAKLKSPWKQVVNVMIAAAFLGCTLFAAAQSYQVVTLYLHNGTVSTAAEIPLYIPHAALLVGFTLMALAVIVRLKEYITGTFERSE
jgi:TRAP-type C4-dicarboxylate transport system permease small subunit